MDRCIAVASHGSGKARSSAIIVPGHHPAQRAILESLRLQDIGTQVTSCRPGRAGLAATRVATPGYP
jgi:hypothetical protein